MKATTWIHGLWLAIAGGAYWVGRISTSSAEVGGNEETPRITGSIRSRDSESWARNDDVMAVERRPSLEVGALNREEMALAIEKILAEKDLVKQHQDFTALLASLTAENAEAAVRALQGRLWNRRNWEQQYRLLVYAWGHLDGEAAMAYAHELEGRRKERVISVVLSGWASEDPATAKAWVTGLEDIDERRNRARALVHGLAQWDVAAATDYALSLPKDDHGRLIETITRQQLSQGVEVAKQWTEILPTGDIKAGALARIAEEWAEEKPAESVTWVTTLPEGEGRARAMRVSMREWVRRDLKAAGEFLTGLESGRMRDAGVGIFAQYAVREDPAAAMEWAESIGDDGERAKTVVQVARRWLRKDEAAARDWMGAAELENHVKEEIQKP